MGEGLREAVAYVFRRKGGDALTPEDLRNLVSFDLRWFTPSEARRFLDEVRTRDLVAPHDGGPGLQPTFDVHAVELPVPFKPGPEILEDPPTSSTPAAGDETPTSSEADDVEGTGADRRRFRDIVDALGEAAGWDDERVLRKVDQEMEQRGGLLTREAAALLLAAREGVDVTAWTPGALEQLRSEGRDADVDA